MKKIKTFIKKFIIRVCEYNIIASKTIIAVLEFGDVISNFGKVELKESKGKEEEVKVNG